MLATVRYAGHERCVIAEGDPQVLIDGVPVAFEGHESSCGASLISTVGKSRRGYATQASMATLNLSTISST